MDVVEQSIEEFTYSNIPQSFDDYDIAKTYIYESDIDNLTSDSVALFGNYYYRSVINDNLGNNPEKNVGVSWTKLRVSNKKAMLDYSSLSRSIADGEDLIVEFNRGNITNIALGNFDASLVRIEILDVNGDVLSDFTQEEFFSVNEDVYDYYSYIYSNYRVKTDRNIYFYIPLIGDKVRVTFADSFGGSASCGFLFGGKAIYIGDTMDEISFGFNSFATKEQDQFGTLTIINRSVQELVDFETLIEKGFMLKSKREVKDIYNKVVLFVLDPSKESEFENLLGLGVIENSSLVGEFNSTHSIMSFSVFEAI